MTRQVVHVGHRIVTTQLLREELFLDRGPGAISSVGLHSYTVGTMCSGVSKDIICTTRSFVGLNVMTLLKGGWPQVDDSKSCSTRGQDDVSQEFLF